MTSVGSIGTQPPAYCVTQLSFLIEPGNPTRTAENIDQVVALLENLDLKEDFSEAAEMGFVLIVREIRRALLSIYDPDANRV